MNLRLLRDETRPEHEATEAILPLSSPLLQREQYGAILQCFMQVVQGWETWATAHAPARLASMVAERQRTPLLQRDLDFFQIPALAPPVVESIDALRTLLQAHPQDSGEREAIFLGAMYVIEGSTLGGQYIAQHVEDLFQLEPGKGDAYFRGYGERTGSMWNSFREVLGAVPEQYSPLVIAAAKCMFGYVQSRMQLCPAVEQLTTAPRQTVEGS